MHLPPMVEMQRVLSWVAGPALFAELTAMPSLSDTDTTLDESPRLQLFGAGVPWNSSEVIWHAVDDRVRGGSSQSHLKLLDSDDPKGSAIFSGVLDTETLGGAGFASQSTIPKTSSSHNTEKWPTWDLSSYDGLRVVVGQGDSKKYTLTLKDKIAGRREDGREMADVSWEYVFDGPTTKGRRNGADESEEQEIFMLWDDFRPTYRGREKKDSPPFRQESTRQIGLMMRSFFAEQEGPFELEVKSIEAVKKRMG